MALSAPERKKKMKKYYFAAYADYTGRKEYYTREEWDAAPTRKKFYAFVVSASEQDNLLSVFARYGGIVAANPCQTKKRAAEIVNFWNECYKKNGTYALCDTPLF